MLFYEVGEVDLFNVCHAIGVFTGEEKSRF